jgi:site-specific DNA recombinase
MMHTRRTLTMRVALYVRVSTEEQAEGFSIDAQLRALRQFADERRHEIVEEFVDRGFSATTDKRPAFQEMIASARARAFDAVLVHKLDRFSRNLEQAVTYKALLKRESVAVISVTEPMDDSPASFVTEGVLQVLAAWYSKNLAQEVAKGRRERHEKGLWNGNLPFGYAKNVDGCAVLVEKEAEAVREAFARYATGRYSYQEVADWLNDQGFRTRNIRRNPKHGIVGSAPFTRDGVRDILSNPFYKGLVRYKGKDEHQGRQPAIVDEALWQSVRQAGRRRHHGPGTYIRPHRTYLLAGLIRCDDCGGKLWAQRTPRGATYYREYTPLTTRSARSSKGCLFRRIGKSSSWRC